jgi:hypothetical protein
MSWSNSWGIDTPSSSPQFTNRKTGLVFFGILTILGGCVCALFFLLTLVISQIKPPNGNQPPPGITTLPVLMYGTMAVALVWLGIGSTQGRRWARALLAILSWMFLVFGVSGLAFLGIMAPHMKEAMAAAHPANQSPLPDSAVTAIVIVVLGLMSVFTVVGPLIWALFYSGRNVRATCEVMDPVPRWTDRCPLPVLGVTLWLLVAAILIASMSLFYPVAPLFGMLTTRAAARVYYLILAIVWLYAAWAIYRLDIRGWWVALAAMILQVVSSVITFSRYDLTEIYTLLGYSADQIALTQKMGVTRWITPLSTVIWTIPVIIYLLYLRKFFSAPKPDTT